MRKYDASGYVSPFGSGICETNWKSYMSDFSEKVLRLIKSVWKI